MDNPWLQLPDGPPYVLPEDEKVISGYNCRLDRNDPRRVELDILPEPFLGYHDSPVLVLLANPGSDPGDREMFGRQWVDKANRESLRAPGGAPIYSLAEEVADTPGGGWWRSATKGLLAPGRDYSCLAQKILVVEFHGYHSPKSSDLGDALPSQRFAFWLVREAVKMRKVIIVASASRSWYRSVPALEDYPLKVTKNSPQNRALSAGNLGVDGFRVVSAALGE